MFQLPNGQMAYMQPGPQPILQNGQLIFRSPGADQQLMFSPGGPPSAGAPQPAAPQNMPSATTPMPSPMPMPQVSCH